MCLIEFAGLSTAANVMANVSIFSTVASSGMQAMGAIQQGKSAAAMAKYQQGVAQNAATVAKYKADDAIERGKLTEKRHRLQVAQLKGTQRAGYASRGIVIDQDTPLETLEDTAALGEMDALIIRNNAEREAWGYEVEASNAMATAGMYGAAAGQYGPASALMAGTTLLTGAGSVADKWYKFS